MSTLTPKEEARLYQLMAAPYALTKPERRRLAALLRKWKSGQADDALLERIP